MSDSMNAEEYREAIGELGLTIVGAAKFLGVNEKTGRDWADTRMKGPPENVAMLLDFMRARGISPAELVYTIERYRADEH